MKTSLPAAFLAHLQAALLTTAWLVRVDRQDGVSVGFTNYIKNITFDSLTYYADAGITPTDIEAISNFDNDNYAFEGAFTENGITRNDVLTERYDNADVKVYLVNYTDPDNQYALVRAGRMGVIKPSDLGFTAEVLGLSQFLQNTFSEICSSECRADLGDERCQVNLNYFGEYGVVQGVSETEPRKTFAAEIIPQQWVNDTDPTDILLDVGRWSNTIISDPDINMEASSIVTAPYGTFASIPTTGDAVTEVINAGTLTFKNAGDSKKLYCTTEGAFDFLSVGYVFRISDSLANDGLFKVHHINNEKTEIIIEEDYTGTDRPGAFVDENESEAYDVTFKVYPVVGASYVFTGFNIGQNSREHYILQKVIDEGGVNDDQLVLGGQGDLVVKGYFESEYVASFLHFEDVTGGDDKLTCEGLYSLHFLYPDCVFEISGSEYNDGLYKVKTINSDENEITIDETYTDEGKPGAFMEETGTIDYAVKFKVWPRAEASTQRYYGFSGLFGAIGYWYRINVTGFLESANNGEDLTVSGPNDDRSCITMYDEALVDELRESKDVEFTIPKTVPETSDTTINIYPTPGPDYEVIHQTDEGDEKWSISGSDWFTGGFVMFVTGDNAGLKKEIRKYDFESWSVLGIVPSFHLLFNMPYEIQEGDLFVVFAGCNKTASDCANKFNNIANFRGEPFCPGEDQA